ncbi:hypothetical protein SAPIO_CDS3758 [Scedosporium apiospermum]|uniref:Uncharacterized protein n=1 Tax=Pseudallescheria apiosperma TaxID=563466 RepID=A0A084G9L9_PSEDA|nr:uncharacterized protein SAPIO_CDS3758 [Scedosporium apiospermum]KEZ44031.1 hypothetical protein SAPIO_CDS3758 [Scedosporium apiospermum]
MKFSGLLAAAFAFTAYASVIPAQAPPAVADVGHCLDCTVSAVLTTVTDLKATVDKELVSITALVGAGDLTVDVVAEVKAKIVSLTAEVEVVVNTVLPLVAGIDVALAVGDLQVLLNLVVEVTALVSGLEKTLAGLVVSLGDDVATLTVDLGHILYAVNCLLTAVLNLVFSIVGSVTECVPLVGELLQAANGLLAIVNGLLTGTLAEILVAVHFVEWIVTDDQCQTKTAESRGGVVGCNLADKL